MRSWTYSEVLEKVQNDLDMQDEDLISTTEWLGLYNEAIDEAEAEIHTLGKEAAYFLAKYDVPLITGTEKYAYPSDIYGNKVRKILYNDGSTKYEVTRIRNLLMLNEIDTEDDYQWLPTNNAADGYRFTLFPTSRETSSTVMDMWYIRNAKRATLTTDVLDIPEFANFIMAYMKEQALDKAKEPSVVKAIVKTKEQRDLMISTLTEMVVDENDLIELDFSHYDEHV